MQGTDERYRLSVAFQVRPVMIMPSAEPHASLLVGIDYTTAPETIIGEDGIAHRCLPSLGPRLDRVEPAAVRDWRTASKSAATDLHGADHRGRARRCGVDHRRAARRTALSSTVEGSPGTADRGRQPRFPPASIRCSSRAGVFRRHATRSSNLLAARLLPTVTGANFVAGTLTINGRLLGTASDDVVVAFYQEGSTVRLFDAVTPAANQQTLTVTGIAGVPPGAVSRDPAREQPAGQGQPDGDGVTMNMPARMPIADPVAFLPGAHGEDPLAQYWLRQVTLRLRREVCWLWRERAAPERRRTPGPPRCRRSRILRLGALDLARYRPRQAGVLRDDVTAAHLSELHRRIAAPGGRP